MKDKSTEGTVTWLRQVYLELGFDVSSFYFLSLQRYGINRM